MDLGSFYHQKILSNNDNGQKISQQAELTPNHPHPGQCECGIEHTGIRAEDSNRIVGGDFVTNHYAHPWIVSLLPKWTRIIKLVMAKYGPFARNLITPGGESLYSWLERELSGKYQDKNPEGGPDSRVGCGGSIISPNYIFTAAHCVINTFEIVFPNGMNIKPINEMIHWEYDEIEVTIGLHNTEFRRDNNYIHTLKDIKTHPSYNDDFRSEVLSGTRTRTDYDYAILTLSSSLTFTDKISPVCLPASTNNMYNGEIARAAGWGSTRRSLNETGHEINHLSRRLKELYYNVWSNEDCDNAIKDSSTPELICRYATCPICRCTSKLTTECNDECQRRCQQQYNCQRYTCQAQCQACIGYEECRSNHRIRSTHVCVYGNVTGHASGMVCSGDSGGPLTVMENGRFAERHTKKC